MTKGLPTLKGLRAFEEAYRLRSFTAAARKLNVQQPAISYQIKRLEEDLGVALFDKQRGGAMPTLHAHALYETVSRAFESIRHTSEEIRQTTQAASFAIATYPGIGTYWLSYRLPLLSQALGQKTKLVTLKRDADLWREPANCWIAFGHGTWQDRDARLLIREQVCPVAAPHVAEQVLAGQVAIGEQDARIIEQEDPESRWLGWDNWFAGTSKAPEDRIEVNDHGLALHMALAGQGVALAWLGVVDDLLAGRSLIRLSDQLLTSEAGYWLVGREGFFDTARGQTVLRCLTPGEGLTLG
ncbi:LysR family transcriptional regulator [Pacificoceanicola onchidii]|uniref:LysR family transcriptional regulator n=1 Tax=Pacificoceanicola onchidii TaxID=2562685 RepID=UPI0010A42BAE|nr:LysR family transcriptional regulator [Pacificoceanicola onchidii]